MAKTATYQVSLHIGNARFAVITQPLSCLEFWAWMRARQLKFDRCKFGHLGAAHFTVGVDTYRLQITWR